YWEMEETLLVIPADTAVYSRKLSSLFQLRAISLKSIQLPGNTCSQAKSTNEESEGRGHARKSEERCR
ncbi:hypothetical protein CHS0354_037307, partial [Potamilus streckersoni]